MGQSARVTSIETVERFRNALCEFGKDVQDSLGAAEMQIHRTFDWLAERLKYWQHQIRVREEELVRAKIELTSRKFANRDGKGAGITDQEKAFRKAQARLKEAEDKVACCRRWHPLLEHAVKEYQGPARQLSSAMDIDLVHSLALLDQKLAALDAYLRLAPPSTSDVASVGSSFDSAAAGEALPSVSMPAPAEPSEAKPEESAAEKQPEDADEPLAGSSPVSEKGSAPFSNT